MPSKATKIHVRDGSVSLMTCCGLFLGHGTESYTAVLPSRCEEATCKTCRRKAGAEDLPPKPGLPRRTLWDRINEDDK